MRRIHNRVASLDVHRDTVVACCQVAHPNQSVEVTKQSFSTTSKGLGELAASRNHAANSPSPFDVVENDCLVTSTDWFGCATWQQATTVSRCTSKLATRLCIRLIEIPPHAE